MEIAFYLLRAVVFIVTLQSDEGMATLYIVGSQITSKSPTQSVASNIASLHFNSIHIFSSPLQPAPHPTTLGQQREYLPSTLTRDRVGGESECHIWCLRYTLHSIESQVMLYIKVCDKRLYIYMDKIV